MWKGGGGGLVDNIEILNERNASSMIHLPFGILRIFVAVLSNLILGLRLFFFNIVASFRCNVMAITIARCY